MIFALTSCMEAAQNPRDISSNNNSVGVGADAGNPNGDGVVGGDDDGGVGEGGEISAKVELRHLIEPKIDDEDDGGDYKRKLTVPKNYNGLLYLAGINVSTLASKRIKARFKFGVNSLPVDIDATVATGAGLTPQTGVQVLVLDMRNRPFNDIQLIYDLFDYNEYDFDGSGNNPAALADPVQFNRNDKLYCRGVKLENDPTFSGQLSTGCVGTGDVCKYSYAKIVDQGLIKESLDPDVPDSIIFPSEPNIQSGTLGLYDDTDAIKLQRCLPDNPNDGTLVYKYDDDHSFTTFGDNETIDGSKYFYRGPYKALNTDEWEVSSDAIIGSNGIFGDTLIAGLPEAFGFQSRLFPLYTKFNLLSSTEYFGAITPDDDKGPITMSSNGESEWMDGCNARATSTHDITGEHVGSCNVTSTIEIVVINDDGTELVMDTAKDVKLQLVKPSTLDTNGENVLHSGFTQCSSSNQCGSDECCINKHCWDKSIVKQCIEDLPSYGNLETGDGCTSDFQCSSLCCNKIDGRCAPHDPLAENPSYCSKPSGQTCVSKEWCQKHPVTTCGIVSTGSDNQGNVTCALRCITVAVHGDCSSSDGVTQGVCIPPDQPDTPVFDPNDPQACDGALSFGELEQCANNPELDCSLE